ncbi:MAG: sigma-70 family RNA polymerase sigma factor [Deltaproteobacteria bacterium]|nr:sigma-70 family RNA polymerase sigma factor [Deltaproteobacteria bacterium]
MTRTGPDDSADDLTAEQAPPRPTALTRIEPERSEGALVPSDPLARYLGWIRQFPIHAADQQMELARAYRDRGDKQAARALLTSNLRLVVKIAYEYKRRWAEMLELIQEGNLGLVEAIERFDPLRGVPFTSYAQYWIRAYILRYVMDNFRTVRLSSTRSGRKLFWRLRKERAKLEQEGFVPTTRLLAERTGVTEQEIIDVSRVLDRAPLSLEAPTRGADGETGQMLGERLQSDLAPGPEQGAAVAELRAKVSQVLARFEAGIEDKREREIFKLRLVAEDPVPLREMGARMGISRERVRQLESRLRQQLAKALQDELGEESILEFVRGD